MDRHVTSVFSDYETIDNNSINSRQLQYWLKQISQPVTTPITPALNPFQWTFMSNQSSHAERNNRQSSHFQAMKDEISFGKSINSSIEKDKENNSLVSNNNSMGSSAENRNKSYVNAMIALQKRVRTLEDQNKMMRKNMEKISFEKNRSLSESCATEEQLKDKIRYLEPKVSKLEQLIEDNKTLRQTKEQKKMKIKQLEKIVKQTRERQEETDKKYVELEQAYKIMNEELKEKCEREKVYEAELRKERQRNNKLESCKQQSTVNLLSKYNQCLQYVKQTEKENSKLKNQVAFWKNKCEEQGRKMQEKYQVANHESQSQIEKLQQVLQMKSGIIEQKQKEVQYFKQMYEAKDEQVASLIKAQQLEKQKQMEIQQTKLSINKNMMEKEAESEKQIKKQQQKLRMAEEKQKKQLESIQPKVQSNAKKTVIQAEKQHSSSIKVPQTLVPYVSGNKKRSFQGFQSDQEQEEDQFDESVIPVSIETKSVGKPIQKRRSNRKGVVSSQSRKSEARQSKNEENVKISNLASPKQIKKVSKKKKENKDGQEKDVTMKSYEPPKTQPQIMQKAVFDGVLDNHSIQSKQNRIYNSYYYSSQYPPLPYVNVSHKISNIQEDVHDFHYKNNISSQSIEEAMLIELQKQLLELYEEQQNLIMASNDDYATQAERSQFVGRLKQINQLLRSKNQKICEIKSKF